MKDESIFLLIALACNLCFSLEDGFCIGRVDLADAPMCALVRGASVSNMGESEKNMS